MRLPPLRIVVRRSFQIRLRPYQNALCNRAAIIGLTSPERTPRALRWQDARRDHAFAMLDAPNS
jgi:hypothetical protein